MKPILTFQIHPLKDEIVKRWSEGQNSAEISRWLEKEHPDLTLSKNTLCKHYLTWKSNIEAEKKDKREDLEIIRATKKMIPVEEILWETIKQCRKKKKDKTISVKDWQYLDQQLQSAVEKLIRIQGSSGDTRDISTIMAEIFKHMDTDIEVDISDHTKREISEEEKLDILRGVDNESKDVDKESDVG